MENDDIFGKFGSFVNRGARSLRDRFVMDVTDLIRAVDKNSIEEVERALRAGVDADVRDAVGRRALTMAVDNNSVVIVKMILDTGANPNLPGRDNNTPLSKAILWENHTILRLLIAAGADANLPAPNGMTAMEEASKSGSESMIALMEEQRINRRNNQVEQDRARHEALKNKAKEVRARRAVEQQQIEEAEKQRKAAAAIATKKEAEKAATRNYKDENEDNLTAYVRALRQKDESAAKLFLEKILDVNAVHPELKTTPLLEAIREEASEIIRYLMEREADAIHPVGGTEHSPLSMAVKKKAYKLVKLILEKNEDTVVEVLNDPDQVMSLQYFAYKDAKMLNLLLDAGADPFFGGRDLPSPISRAIEKASIAILPVLVKNRVDLNNKVDEKTPLEWAIEHNKLAWVIGLLAEGVDTKQTNVDGLTPLALAQKLEADEAIIGALSH